MTVIMSSHATEHFEFCGARFSAIGQCGLIVIALIMVCIINGVLSAIMDTPCASSPCSNGFLGFLTGTEFIMFYLLCVASCSFACFHARPHLKIAVSPPDEEEPLISGAELSGVEVAMLGYGRNRAFETCLMTLMYKRRLVLCSAGSRFDDQEFIVAGQSGLLGSMPSLPGSHQADPPSACLASALEAAILEASRTQVTRRCLQTNKKVLAKLDDIAYSLQEDGLLLSDRAWAFVVCGPGLVLFLLVLAIAIPRILLSHGRPVGFLQNLSFFTCLASCCVCAFDLRKAEDFGGGCTVEGEVLSSKLKAEHDSKKHSIKREGDDRAEVELVFALFGTDALTERSESLAEMLQVNQLQLQDPYSYGMVQQWELYDKYSRRGKGNGNGGGESFSGGGGGCGGGGCGGGGCGGGGGGCGG